MQYQNNNSRFEFGSSSNQQSGGNNAAWIDDQNNYDNRGFGGEFGAFDEGYFDGGRISTKAVAVSASNISLITIVIRVPEGATEVVVIILDLLVVDLFGLRRMRWQM
jgi:hypothetical protein